LKKFLNSKVLLCACEGVVGHTKLNKRDRKERDAVGGQECGRGKRSGGEGMHVNDQQNGGDWGLWVANFFSFIVL
jgi:hypothetical protein